MGEIDPGTISDDFEEAYGIIEQEAGVNLLNNIQDKSFRAAFGVAGYKPIRDSLAKTVECSQQYTIANFNSIYYGFSEENQFVHDPRGYSALIEGQASEFLTKNISRVLYNTIATKVTWTDDSVIIESDDGNCVEAESSLLGQGHPVLPLRIPLNARLLPHLAIKSLDAEGFLPGSGILLVAVVTEQSSIVEAQDDDTTKEQALEVLRELFGADNVPAYGSYPNWPPGLTLEGHQNLRANTGLPWYAGEAYSAEYYGYMQGAYVEGKLAVEAVAACLHGVGGGSCMERKRYEVLTGSTPADQYNVLNGWLVTSVQTIGDVGLEGGGG
ncbi:MAG: hypothetical protein M1833_007309 [Piccolia ochrophora]|nr:MAG: hypothetical protein M1833_007309 [Piccolia ochrophora]